MNPLGRESYSNAEMDSLLAACSKGDISSLERLLRRDVDVDTSGWLEDADKECTRADTMLEVAARHEQLETMEYLIEKGANVNLKNDGETALLSAAYAGSVQVLKILIGKGADIIKDAL